MEIGSVLKSLGSPSTNSLVPGPSFLQWCLFHIFSWGGAWNDCRFARFESIPTDCPDIRCPTVLGAWDALQCFPLKLFKLSGFPPLRQVWSTVGFCFLISFCGCKIRNPFGRGGGYIWTKKIMILCQLFWWHSKFISQCHMLLHPNFNGIVKIFEDLLKNLGLNQFEKPQKFTVFDHLSQFSMLTHAWGFFCIWAKIQGPYMASCFFGPFNWRGGFIIRGVYTVRINPLLNIVPPPAILFGQKIGFFFLELGNFHISVSDDCYFPFSMGWGGYFFLSQTPEPTRGVQSLGGGFLFSHYSSFFAKFCDAYLLRSGFPRTSVRCAAEKTKLAFCPVFVLQAGDFRQLRAVGLFQRKYVFR